MVLERKVDFDSSSVSHSTSKQNRTSRDPFEKEKVTASNPIQSKSYQDRISLDQDLIDRYEKVRNRDNANLEERFREAEIKTQEQYHNNSEQTKRNKVEGLDINA